MALWGISTTTETAANNYAIPKYKHSVDRNRTPWNTFADVRGWVYRRYGTTEQSGLSSSYYDEVLVPVAGLNTGTDSPGNGENNTGLGTATPVAVFFEDPNLASPISIGAGGTTGIGTGRTGYVHVAWNENVYCSAGATVRIRTFDANGAKQIEAKAEGLLGDAYSELKENDKAISHYKKAGQLFPEDAFLSSEYLFRAGLLLELSGKTNEAISVYKELKEKFPRTEKGFSIDKYLARLGETN